MKKNNDGRSTARRQTIGHGISGPGAKLQFILTNTPNENIKSHNVMKISSVNVRGLKDSHKRRESFCHLNRKKKHEIYCMQNTHFTDKMEPYRWK